MGPKKTINLGPLDLRAKSNKRGRERERRRGREKEGPEEGERAGGGWRRVGERKKEGGSGRGVLWRFSIGVYW